MDYLSIFIEIVKAANDQARPRNQILSDLNLIIYQIKDNLRTYENFMEWLRNSDSGLGNHNLYIALEYNNALLFSSLRPDNFMNLLKKAVEEKRFYFFFTASEMLLAAKINSNLKNELISYITYVKEKLGITTEDIIREIHDEVILIAEKMLEIALDDFYLFRIISERIIKQYISLHDPHSEKFKGDINFDNLKTLYGEIIRYSNSLGL